MSPLSLEALKRMPPLQVASLTISLVAAVALAAALAFEHIGGYRPCALCLIERYAYYGAVPAGLLALMAARAGKAGFARALLLATAIGFIANAGLGAYHSGVEWKWWPGPETCAGADQEGFATGDLLEGLEKTRVIRCDEAPWRLFGLSFAGWSVLISAWLAAIGLCGIAGSRRVA